jgi:non-heme chloroperoxidase
MTLLITFCASAAPGSGGGDKPKECRDDTPHEGKFVTVAPGVNLEVLDWGGSGQAMVLLTGLGDNAHVYDQFAFQFTDYFHVIGITRRGFLPSSQPEDGYDVVTRASDDIAVLDALGIAKAVFVGHSVAGSELSQIGRKYKNRVDKLIYLDALDLAERFAPSRLEPSGDDSLFTSATMKSLWAFQAAMARYDAQREPASAVCPGVKFDENGALIGPTTPAWVTSKILAGVKGSVNPPVDWAKIDAPRLGIFAQFTLKARQPWYWYLPPTEQAEFDKAWPPITAWYQSTISKFAHGNPVRSFVLLGAPHYIYIDNETEVVREMWKFLRVPFGGN